MKNIAKAVKKQIVSNKASAGGEMMRVGGVSDPRFSRMKSAEMFPEKSKKSKPKMKETHNPSGSVKPLKKMKGKQK
jgi:hypothetical protein